MNTFSAIRKIVAGAIICIAAIATTSHEAEESEFAIDSIATVNSIREHTCGIKINRHKCYEHLVTADGNSFKIDLIETKPIGSKIPIHYLPGQSRAEFGPTNRDATSTMTQEYGSSFMILTLLGIAMLCWGIYEIANNKALNTQRAIQDGKYPCKRCGKPVLPSTIQRTNGNCMPCFKKISK